MPSGTRCLPKDRAQRTAGCVRKSNTGSAYWAYFTQAYGASRTSSHIVQQSFLSNRTAAAYLWRIRAIIRVHPPGLTINDKANPAENPEKSATTPPKSPLIKPNNS